MTRTPFRMLARMMSLSLGGPRLSILIYHRVNPARDPLFPADVDAAAFAEQMAMVSRMFKVFPLEEGISRLREGTLPAGAAAVTFDDGYADNAEIALPILRQAGITATFFIATGFLDGGRMWNDTIIEFVRRVPGDVLDLRDRGFGMHPVSSLSQRHATIQKLILSLKYLPPAERLEKVNDIVTSRDVSLPGNMMMRSEQVRELHAAGMGIGAHTVTHPILAATEREHARTEMAEGKRQLQDIIGAPVNLFAYPNGKPGQDYCREHVTLAREVGFTAAFSTAWGAASRLTDPYQIPRFTPWDHDPLRFQARMVANLVRKQKADALETA
jgi:peptidoglycan/xylan/chitin deacetylase (PgdA/CDA1 family)